MTGKIALEEHFALAKTLGDSERYLPAAVWQRMHGALTGVHEKCVKIGRSNAKKLFNLP